MKILVTGANGFIGKYLCTELEKDHIVTRLGRNDFPRVAVAYDRPDVVFHLAANSDIVQYHAEEDIKSTLLTTLELLDVCATYGVKQFVFTSSGTVYGNNTWAEETHKLNPLSHYAAAKVASEAFISSYSNIWGIRSWICRLPNVIGKDNHRGIVHNFVNQIKEHPQELRILGNGMATKPYMRVEDCIEAILFVWENAKGFPAVYNISNGGSMSVRQIARMVVDLMGTETEICNVGVDKMWIGDVVAYEPNITKLLSLGWHTGMDSWNTVSSVIKEMI